MGKLKDKVAVITGATSGMALATAKLFVEEGAYVFITGRRQKKLDEAVKAIGRNVTGVQGDAGNLADLDRLYETVKKEKGRIDVLFASAGTGEFAPIGEVTEEQFDKTFGVNVRGTLFTVQKALPLFSDGGSIIMNGSIAGSMGFPAFGVYSASKAAVRSFARTWTVDLKARNIRVNVLSPGTIDTPILEGVPKETHRRLRRAHPPGHDGAARGDRDRGPLPRVERFQLRHRKRAVRRRRRRPDLTRAETRSPASHFGFSGTTLSTESTWAQNARHAFCSSSGSLASPSGSRTPARSVPRAQRRSCVQAQRSVLVSGRDHRPNRNGSLLERDRRQGRPGERVRLEQGQMGIVLADYADRPDESVLRFRSRCRQAHV